MSALSIRCLATIILFLGFTAGAQDAKPTPQCADAELRASLAESRLLAEQIKREVAVKTSEDLRASKGNEIDRLKQRNLELEALLEDKDRKLKAMSSDLDVALTKIKKANGRFLCQVLHDGCIR